MKAKTGAMWIAAVLSACLLGGCGGSGSDTSQGTVRLVNATKNYGALDLYTADTEELSAVAETAASPTVTLDPVSYTVKLKPAGVATTVATQTLAVAAGTPYTVVAYNTSATTLATAIFTDTQAAPSSGYASLRVFNAGGGAGAVDVYVAAADADMSTAVASATLSSATIGSYVDFPQGTYHLRITGAGDRTDVRLDVPSFALVDQQVATFMLTAASTGALVDGLLVNQAGSTTAYRNANARVRVVAAMTGNGSVAATTSDGSVSTALQSPSVGAYAVVPAALPGLVVKVNGVAIDTSTLAVSAGADVTLLVYGNAAAPQWRLLVDDNLPSTSTTNTKLRVVHVLNGLDSTVSLSADYVGVADNIAFGTSSAAADVTASTTMRLEVDSPVRTTPLYLATDVTLAAQKVYTLFVMGDAASPVTVLRKDR